MAMSNEDLLKELSAKPIMEVVELVKMLEDEWGVSAAAPVAVAAGPAAGGEAAAAATQLETAQQKLASLQRKAGSVKPRILAEADEAVQDADTMITITGDKVMRAEKQLRDVILEEFPPNRQDVLRNKYL